jgi:hypothetical protein
LFISDDEAIASRGAIFGGMNQGGPREVGGMTHQMIDPSFEIQHHHQVDPPVNAYDDINTATDHQYYGDDTKSVASGTSSLMGGAQSRLKQKRMMNMR